VPGTPPGEKLRVIGAITTRLASDNPFRVNGWNSSSVCKGLSPFGNEVYPMQARRKPVLSFDDPLNRPKSPSPDWL